MIASVILLRYSPLRSIFVVYVRVIVFEDRGYGMAGRFDVCEDDEEDGSVEEVRL